MKNRTQMTVEFGDLVLATYDEAARYSDDPREVSCLAAQTVQEILWHAPRPKLRIRHFGGSKPAVAGAEI